MKENKVFLVDEKENEVMEKRKKELNRYIKKSFFHVFIVFVICCGFMIKGLSDVYHKQNEVTEIKNEISIENQKLESLKLEILSLKGFDKVMGYAEYLGMDSPELGKGIVVDLSKDNFSSKEDESVNKPVIVKIYEKIFKRKE